MEIVIHRINSIKKLKEIPKNYGTEIDIRAHNSSLVLNHEPFSSGDLLEDYLDNYQHKTLILNVKDSGIEDNVLKLVRERSHIKEYFLLDIELPYLVQASIKGEKNMAVRFSEEEPIEFTKNYINKVDWVWIDTFTKLPVNNDNIDILNKFKRGLVCPERWGRKQDIKNYKERFSQLKFKVNVVMTSLEYALDWLK